MGTGRTVIVFGADGYLGWATALHLSQVGFTVIAADNLIRRSWDRECGTDTLIPIRSMPERVRAWREVSGNEMLWRRVDIRNPKAVNALFMEFQPDAVVHFAEQRSAPFSMVDQDHSLLTQVGNLTGTINLLYAIRDIAPDCHLVKLGTMGEYGTPNIDIEEGFIEITHNGRTDRLPYPKQAGSFYHLSKVHDSHNIHFASRVWGIRATDLNQGVVYGCTTDEIAMDRRLATRFDYDTIWGTALNRFCAQAAVNQPITVYGKGGQTRGFLDIRDTVECIRISIEHPAEPHEFRVFNQFTEQFSVQQLATLIAEARKEHDLATSIDHVANPRIEQEEHYYNAKHQALIDLGLQPHLLRSTLLDSVIATVEHWKKRVDLDLLLRPSVDWKKGRNLNWKGASHPHLTQVRSTDSLREAPLIARVGS